MLSLNNNTKIFLINFLLFSFPISFILGNLIINLNILILIITTFILYGRQIFEIEFSTVDKTVLLFFSYIVAIGIFNNYFNFDFSAPPHQEFLLTKSLAYTRYLLLYFVIKFLILKNLVKFKFLFICFGLSALFVSIDIIIQFYFGKDLFGFEGSGRRLSGLFQDEYIAGAYIQRFYIFMPLSMILYWLKEKKFFYYLLFFITLLISLFGIMFSGNRMPLVLFIITLTIFLAYQKEFHKILIVSLLVFIFSIYYLVNNNTNFHWHFKTFVNKGFQITSYFQNKLYGNETNYLANTYVKEFETGILTWKQNKIFGGGIKSFYFNCTNIKDSVMDKTGGTNCNSHPHNYYLQIAAELGLVGLIITVYLFLLILFKILRVLHYSKKNQDEKKIPFLALFIAEICPFKTSASFFTTSTSAYLFILIPMIVSFADYRINEIK